MRKKIENGLYAKYRGHKVSVEQLNDKQFIIKTNNNKFVDETFTKCEDGYYRKFVTEKDLKKIQSVKTMVSVGDDVIGEVRDIVDGKYIILTHDKEIAKKYNIPKIGFDTFCGELLNKNADMYKEICDYSETFSDEPF